MHTNRLRLVITGFFTLILTLVSSNLAYSQGVTSSELSGSVFDAQKLPVAGVKVVAVHIPSGTRYEAVTRSNGQYDMTGLRSGGPYAVTVSGPNFSTQTSGDIFAAVGVRTIKDFSVSSEVVKLEAVNVTADQDMLFGSGQTGLGETYTSTQLHDISSVRRDIQDIENLDPRANVMQVSPSDSQYTVSFGGANPKYNQFIIDGVSATDNFGLNSNGVAGFRNPLPPEWIESLRIDLNPADVVFSGAAGGFVDATLKSGTNDFHGSIYALYFGTRTRGPDPVLNAQYGPHEPIQAHTTGATIGGPIIKDKLFFFLGYDAFREITVPPVQNFVPDNSGGVYDQIIAKAKTYGFDPGTFIAPNHQWSQLFVGKIDWNINDDQKFEFTFRHSAGEAPNYGGTSPSFNSSFGTSLSSTWYNTYRTDQSYTAKLTSDWSTLIPNFHTEIEATYKRYNGTAKLNGADFPQVVIEGVPGASLFGATAPYALTLGQWWAYQLNNLYTWEQEEHAYGEYSVGNHTFKFGAQLDRTAYTDTFIRNYLGSYQFASVADWLAGTPTFAQQAAVSPGYTLGSDVAHYYLMDIAPLAEDTWRPNDRLTIVAGLRLDYPYEPQHPIRSAVFYNAYGYTNGTTMSGNYTFSPRIGFTYTFPTEMKTQLRGGAGLFLGQNPVVWVENSFNGAGQLTTVSTGSTSTSPSTAVIPGYTFAGAMPTPLTANPSSAGVEFDVTDPKFKWPSTWKENLAFDRTLPFFGLIFTANIDLWQVNKDVITLDQNLKLAASGPTILPDGRVHYNGNITPGNLGAFNIPGFTYPGVTSVSSTGLEANPATGPVYLLTNTDQGGMQEYTLELNRPMMDGWSVRLAYTHTHATAVDPLSSAVAGSNYGSNPMVNPNDNVAYRSQYAAPDKYVLTAARQFKFFGAKNSTTTLTAQMLWQTGQSYSYVFKGDADGSGLTGESLFYVPTGPSDPLVAWADASGTEMTNFFNWLSTSNLNKYRGQIAPRNAFNAPWQKTVNLHLEQQIPLGADTNARLKVYIDCFNFANLLDKSWGVVTNFNNSFETRTVAGTFLNAAGTQYVYTFNPATLGVPSTFSDMSRWTMQVGATLDF